MLAVDAFSSDSIPVHLLTKECFDLYWRHLAGDRILAIHVSNRFLDLSSVVRGIANAAEKPAIFVKQKTRGKTSDTVGSLAASEWILITSNDGSLQDPLVKDAATRWSSELEEGLLWTYDYTNLFQLLR